MSELYLLQHSDMDASFILGVFSEPQLAEDAMRQWVDGENARRKTYSERESLYELDKHDRNRGQLAYAAEFDWVKTIPVTLNELKDYWR